MSKPWEQYQSEKAGKKPWEMYAAPPQDIQTPGDVQAAKDLTYKHKTFLQKADQRQSEFAGGAYDMLAHPYDNVIRPSLDTAYGIAKDVALNPGALMGAGASLPAALMHSQTAQDALKSTLQPATTAARSLGNAIAPNAINAPSGEEVSQAFRGAGQMALGAVLGEGAGMLRGVKAPIGEKLGQTAPGAFMRERAGSSMLTPKEASFQFGHDPIGEAARIPKANTAGQFVENVKAKLGESETQLHEAIAHRNAMADSVQAPKGIDVKSGIRESYENMAKQAVDNGKPGLAKQLRNMADTRIAKLVEKYGSTYLDPEQILFEKRLLADEVKFAQTDIEQVTVNEAKANQYRAYDHYLDTLVPDAKGINATYGNRLNLLKLSENYARKSMNAPMAKFSSLLPETAFKTRLMNALAGPEPAATGNGVYEFHQPPQAPVYPQGNGGAPVVTNGSRLSIADLLSAPPQDPIYPSGGKSVVTKGGKLSASDLLGKPTFQSELMKALMGGKGK